MEDEQIDPQVGEMEEEKPRRSPFVKEKFLEGNRQKFTVILILCAAGIMFCNVYFKIDPVPYLSFLTFIGSFYLGGATVTAYMAANKTNTNINSSVSNSVAETNTNANIKTEITQKNITIQEITEKDNPLKPFSQIATK